MADTVDAGAGGSLLETTKANAAAAYNSVTSGPVAQNVQDHAQKTGDEFSNLAASRRTPTNPAATGQPLTHYHSFFSELLSWKNPRASGIAYAGVVTLIFAVRYLDILRWGFKLASWTLFAAVIAEAAGKFVLNTGLTSQIRPRQYYTVSREALNSAIGDVHELINFFVIEAQRIVFVENVWASAAACVTAFLAYHLIKIVPYWGLTLIATTMAFFIPLVYTSNQELIDQHLKSASDVINAQTAQVQGVVQKQAEHVSSITKQYAGDYTGKVQEMLRGKGSNPAPTTETIGKQPEYVPKDTAFPTAPVDEPVADKLPEKIPEIPVVPEEEPLIAT